MESKYQSFGKMRQVFGVGAINCHASMRVTLAVCMPRLPRANLASIIKNCRRRDNSLCQHLFVSLWSLNNFFGSWPQVLCWSVIKQVSTMNFWHIGRLYWYIDQMQSASVTCINWLIEPMIGQIDDSLISCRIEGILKYGRYPQQIIGHWEKRPIIG